MIAQELATLAGAQRMSPALVMRDPYILDFLGLQDSWQEGDLEGAIIRETESFLLEPGAGFSFLARQKRIRIDDEDFHLDLLFYNRKLRRLVAVELKIGDFEAAHKGQMELYLRWLDRHEREPGEAAPLGIILCTGKKREQIELLELDRSGIHVAEYLTALPSRECWVKGCSRWRRGLVCGSDSMAVKRCSRGSARTVAVDMRGAVPLSAACPARIAASARQSCYGLSARKGRLASFVLKSCRQSQMMWM